MGIDYSLTGSREARAEAWELAKAMDDWIRIDALRNYFAEARPELDKLLVRSTLATSPRTTVPGNTLASSVSRAGTTRGSRRRSNSEQSWLCWKWDPTLRSHEQARLLNSRGVRCHRAHRSQPRVPKEPIASGGDFTGFKKELSLVYLNEGQFRSHR